MKVCFYNGKCSIHKVESIKRLMQNKNQEINIQSCIAFSKYHKKFIFKSKIL